VLGLRFRVCLVKALRLEPINFELGVLWWLFGSETLKPLNFEILAFGLGFGGWGLSDRDFLKWDCGFGGMDFLEWFLGEGLEAKLDLRGSMGCGWMQWVSSFIEGSSGSVLFLSGMSIWNPGLVPKRFWAAGYGKISGQSFSAGSSLEILIF
jgi:hypothetical protein